MTCLVKPQRPRRPRPQFWVLADDTEAYMSSTPPRPPQYLRALLAAHSVPRDDEPSKPKRSSRRNKLLPHAYDPGFVDTKSSMSEKTGMASTRSSVYWPYWPHGDRRTTTWGRLLRMLSIVLFAAYTACQLSYVARDYYYPPTRVGGVNYSIEPIGIHSWIRSEAHTALRAILHNIGPAAGVPDGIVVASPSTGGPKEPDYYYTWTRDAALTVSALLPFFLPDGYLRPWEASWDSFTLHNHTHPLFEGLVRSYVTAQASIQSTPNPSGNLWTGGLSEPKFTSTGQPFTGSWGRPQRDGPALRALALIPYAHWLLDRGFSADINYVAKNLYDPTSLRRDGSVIKNDLEEVANAWSLSGFDLWEEVRGSHLWGDAMSRRALQAGAGLAARLGDMKAASYYSLQASEISKRMERYYAGETWNATIPTPKGRSGLDVATLLTVIHAGGRNLTNLLSETELAATDPFVLTTLRAYVLSFANCYRINRGPWVAGWLVGRYASDIYDGIGFTGGNPWYIATFSVAHVLYAAQLGFAEAGTIDMSASPAFWADLGFDGEEVTVGEPPFAAALARLGHVADEFVAAAARTIKTGSMSEQIDRNRGKQRGARDLTWSYASFLEMKRARDAASAAMRNIGV